MIQFLQNYQYTILIVSGFVVFCLFIDIYVKEQKTKKIRDAKILEYLKL